MQLVKILGWGRFLRLLLLYCSSTKLQKLCSKNNIDSLLLVGTIHELLIRLPALWIFACCLGFTSDFPSIWTIWFNFINCTARTWLTQSIFIYRAVTVTWKKWSKYASEKYPKAEDENKSPRCPRLRPQSCLNAPRWIVCLCSHGSHVGKSNELFAEESLTTFPGYLLEHQHSTSLLIYSHFRHHSCRLWGEDDGPCVPTCLPRNTLKSSEFKSSSRRSLRAPCRSLWSFTQIPVPPGFPRNTAESWRCMEQLSGREREARHCK